jgi:hypothetical protein
VENYTNIKHEKDSLHRLKQIIRSHNNIQEESNKNQYITITCNNNNNNNNNVTGARLYYYNCTLQYNIAFVTPLFYKKKPR